PNGDVAHVHDVYRNGDYDVRTFVLYEKARDGNRATLGARPLTEEIAQSPKFEARPSAAYDPQGRLWVAYEEGPEKWGKDYGALDAEDGYPLYNARHVRVVCLVDGKLQRPVAELPTSASKTHQPDERTVRYAYPKIGID